MNKLPTFFSFVSKTVKTVIVSIILSVLCTPVFAQTVNTVATGVYYSDGFTANSASTPAGSLLYCNSEWKNTDTGDDRSFVYTPAPASNQNQNDPWVSSALIEYDQPYPSPTTANNYPNHCLGLCTTVACSNLPVGQSTYSIAFPLQRITFDIFKYYNGKNPKNPDELPAIRSIDVYPARNTANFEDYTCGSYHCSNAGKDKTSGDHTREAECLGAHWICDGTNEGKNGEKPSYCWVATMTREAACGTSTIGQGPINDIPGKCYKFKPVGLDDDKICEYDYSEAYNYKGCCLRAGHSDCLIFDNNGAETNSTLSFCTGWDASYEIAGEFGKTNGDFGFRSTVSTDVPSDGVIADRIEISEMGVYPGHNGATQIPIQIDVTNVHTVRSTPSLVGTITPVSAQPYTFQYRLSKDADVRIAIFDASTEDTATYGGGNSSSSSSQNTGTGYQYVGDLSLVCSQIGGTMNGGKCEVSAGYSQSSCTTAGGAWNAAAESELNILSDAGCSAMGGTYEPGSSAGGGNVSLERCVIPSFTQVQCTLYDGNWYNGNGGGNGESGNIGQYCYFTGCTEGLCNYGGFTWQNNGCYTTSSSPSCEFTSITQSVCETAGYIWKPEYGGCVSTSSTGSSNSTGGTTANNFASSVGEATQKIVRTLVDWQPRTGEGMKGTDKDTQISDFDSWDGRHDQGFLLPAGNYIASIQAKTQDEWPGIDFSRAVTRQVSLDPLKLTDVRVTGLNKKSTAYATISYVATESSTVYWEVYTPGTNFTGASSAGDEVSDIFTDSSEPTGTGPEVQTGTLVYRNVEQKTGRMVYTDRWDGTCQATSTDANGKVTPTNCVRTYAYNEKQSDGTVCKNQGGCTEEFAYGAPMPDGNYVYVLWAEIPYNGTFTNAAGGGPSFSSGSTCPANTNNKCFTGVKTLKYTVGNLELERGLVGITMHPASYSTLGSSPTAYGLDPFIFKYALDREAQVIATVENTEGLVVKHLTIDGGEPGVAQQLNTLTWDGRDDQGRMVYPGTYMFRVKAMDAMFPAQNNEAITIFPVDMYRVVDVATTDVYGDSNAKATISYHLSKPMNVQINIYNKDVVIPNYNGKTGEYNDATVQAVYHGQKNGVTSLAAGTSITPAGGTAAISPALNVHDAVVEYKACGTGFCRNTWSAAEEYALDKTKYRGDEDKEYATGKYTIYLKQEVINTTTDADAVWPPRICNTETDAAVFISGHVDPAKVNSTGTKCIYVNDTSFTNYPTSLAQAASGAVDVRLQPIHTFDRTDLSYGDDTINMEEWDALYFYNPTPNAARHTAQEIIKCKGATEKSNCPYEMLPDGQYSYYLSARSNDAFNRYYYDQTRDGNSGTYTISGQPFKEQEDVKQEPYLYASDKVIGKINVTRGPVYFLEDSVQVYPNAPQLFNASSTTLTFIPPYEINFAISRAAVVEAAVVALEPGMCSPVTDQILSNTVNVFEKRTNVAGEICKFLSTMTIVNTGTFDANVIRKLYWDGTDHNGNYVKPGMYEIRLTARNYPDTGLYQPTVKSITISADLLKVFDLLETDSYSIAVRGTDMKIGYQISVPMKVAIQIFKPGTTIYDYSKGTLRNPTTGKEVKDINEVLVRSIVGIRPGTTLIEEVWDGLDYAQQEVPDGIYPFRFVTSLDSARIDSVTGEILVTGTEQAIDYVADTYEYQNLHKATIAIGDGRFVCSDWQKTVLFYPNPLRNGKQGTLEITKMPVPGTVSIKYFNLAGDMVRNADYTCVDANNYQTTMGENLYFQPDNNVSNTRVPLNANGDLTINNVRNAALRCKWDANNQHGKKVARGVYFGLVDFKAFNGREHCQKVVKILIP